VAAEARRSAESWDKADALGGKRVAFVELVAPKPAVTPSETWSAVIEVVLPVAYRVRVAGGFERGTLVDLLDVLEARR